MLRLFTTLTYLAAAIATLMWLAAMGSDTWPKAAALAAGAAALLLIPYSVTRVMQANRQSEESQQAYKALLQVRDKLPDQA